MKRLLFTALLSLPMILSAGQYAGVKAGTDYKHKTDIATSGQNVGCQFGASYGYDFANGVRSEIEVAFRNGQKRTKYTDKTLDIIESKQFDSSHSWSYMTNLIYDVSQLQICNLTPYFGVGVGYVQSVEHRKIKFDHESNSEKRRDSGFAYQGIAGIKYPIAEKLSMDMQYCYHIPGPHTKNHSVTVGIVRAF